MAAIQPKTKLLYTFPKGTFIENIALRPNGHLLLTTFREGSLYDLDPNVPHPEPHLVAQFPDASSLTGIVQIEHDVFAVTGGHRPAPMQFVPGSLKCFRVDLTRGISSPKIDKIADVPESRMLNGMTAIPENPHILLSLDSIAGRIIRINANTGVVDSPVQDALLMPSEDKSKVPLGANGAKIRNGYFYFTNSGRELFARIKINSVGDKQSEVEILVRNEEALEPMPYDDFDFGADGVAYLTRHFDAIFAVFPGQEQKLFLGGNGDQSPLTCPTSVAMSRDGTKLYISCAGKMGEFCGKVVEVDL